MLLKLI